ncbi:casein kinase 2 regulatory subunit [Mycoemilia scoparia]|uniref:Casein kinase II subunit beta n=1 Tax=Mycoemilia scoparia TaxID=417184 RepID=A0A9W7ZY22_9FUNG|nr:casein kinase 2 regulatory subunit [Mycoemilia scoparia]
MMDNIASSGSESDFCEYWVDMFLSIKGNEFFCQVDEDYMQDRFNLTGLEAEVDYYIKALRRITDHEVEIRDKYMDQKVEESARHLYGLIHARYILTNRGLHKMLEKYRRGDFGRCPRYYCNQQPLLPIGMTDEPKKEPVKLYCCSCEDVYNPKSNRHNAIDGAYFGTSFPGMLFQVYPSYKPDNSSKPYYIPKMFGFKIYESAELLRWREKMRDEQVLKIKETLQQLE